MSRRKQAVEHHSDGKTIAMDDALAKQRLLLRLGLAFVVLWFLIGGCAHFLATDLAARINVYTRFFRHVRGLSNAEVQRLCNVNYDDEVAFIATTGSREEEQIIGQSCYFINPSTNLADTAFMAHPGWQGCGLGSALQACMAVHATKRGVRGFVADILPTNAKMLRLAHSSSYAVQVQRNQDSVQVTQLF